MKKQKPLKIK